MARAVLSPSSPYRHYRHIHDCLLNPNGRCGLWLRRGNRSYLAFGTAVILGSRQFSRPHCGDKSSPGLEAWFSQISLSMLWNSEDSLILKDHNP
jgi:hypothetical protein